MDDAGACACHEHRVGCPMRPEGDKAECACRAEERCPEHGVAALAEAPPLPPLRPWEERQLQADQNKKLAEELAQAKRERDGWMDMAKQACHDAAAFRSLLVGMGVHFGQAAYTSDDGSVQRDVLVAKIPDLVAGLASTLRDSLIREVQLQNAIMQMLLAQQQSMQTVIAALEPQEQGK